MYYSYEALWKKNIFRLSESINEKFGQIEKCNKNV